jgi:hypothetical protein
MLIPEEMARIEDEERKRHAEEQYRAQIRSALQQPARPSALVNAPTATIPKSGGGSSFLRIIGGAALLLGVVWLGSNLVSRATSDSKEPFSPSIRYETKTDRVATGQIVVQAGGAMFYKFTVTREMKSPVVAGNFSATVDQVMILRW